MKTLIISLSLLFFFDLPVKADSLSNIKRIRCTQSGGAWNAFRKTCIKRYKKPTYSKYGSQYKNKKNSRKYNSYQKKKSRKYNTYKNNGNYKAKKSSRGLTALVFCWANRKGNKWSCDGPTQKLLTYWKSLDQARTTAGCRDYNRKRTWVSGSKSGYLFTCSRKLESYSRDIRGLYGIHKGW